MIQEVASFPFEHVSPDDECAFGKWLYSLPPNEQQTFDWRTVKQLHAEFHQEAARILQMALASHKQEAEDAIGFKSEYAKKSARLTEAMVNWKNAM